MTDQEKSLSNYVSDLAALEEHIRKATEAEREARAPGAFSRASGQANDRAEGAC